MAPAGGNFLWGLPANPQKMPNLYGLQAHPLTEEFFFGRQSDAQKCFHFYLHSYLSGPKYVLTDFYFGLDIIRDQRIL